MSANLFDYYFDGKSMRRYRPLSETGERWNGTEWTPQCAFRAACQITGDERIDELEAAMRIPEAFAGKGVAA